MLRTTTLELPYIWCLKCRYEKCQDSWFIHVSSFSVFYKEPWTGKRIVGERVGRSQHPWNMNISSSFSHHKHTNTYTHTCRVPSRTPGYRCFNFAASERGVGRVFSGLISPWHAMLHGHSSDLVTDGEKESRTESGGGSSRRMMKPRHYRKSPGLDKARENTSERFIFLLSNFKALLKKYHLLSLWRKSQHLRCEAFHFWCSLHQT